MDLDIIGLLGFLEHSRDPSTQNKLQRIPPVLCSSDDILPHYRTSTFRNLETGEVFLNDTSQGIQVSYSGQNTIKRDSSALHNVAELRNELTKRLKDLKLNSNVADRIDIHEKILSAYPESVINRPESLCVGTHAGSRSKSLDLTYLEPETRLLLAKRSRPIEPVRKYAILEDTSEQLPNFANLIKDPAYTWPFELDTFQKQAILCLERNQSVFVAAHTSAGKTVVAEYATALCRRRGSRIIYTSPIKALSNQKFYDFKRTFGEDVGLLTGDLKVATDSSLLIMTTEILYNMLCNTADAIRDLEIVIMDEVHYLNDAERGHVWEQIMIMLPNHVLLVMLSATVPNTMEFADWLGRIRGSEIHVVVTDKRPVPLKHYLFTGLDGQGSDKHLHMIVDENGLFSLPGYKQSVLAYNNPTTKKNKPDKPVAKDTSRADELAAMGRGGGAKGGKNDGTPGKGRGSKKQDFTGGKFNTPGRMNYMPSSGGMNVHEKRTKNMWLGIVRLLQERSLMPAIAFGFSRNSLEVIANHLSSVDLLSKSEKNEVHQFLRFSIKNHLKGSDIHLPSVLFVKNLAARGIAVHHGGMLPILKETVEMLFQRGLIRLLFATETFAMGVNMPARCVVFSTLEKFDGRRRRPLNPGEYTQMAGRAGRRGLDSSGTVIILVENMGASVASKSGVPSQETLTSMILGTPTQLQSQFKITYSMILHLHRTNWLTPQDVMRRSFMEAPSLRREIERRQCLSQLRAKILQTTTSLSSAGANSSSAPTAQMTKAAPSTTTSAVPLAEPVLLVKCPHGQSQCVDTMATYYQACCKFRQLSASVSTALAERSLPDLQRVFCAGRLLFIHVPALIRKTVDHTTDNVSNWLVPAMVVDVLKVSIQGRNEIQWNVITWQTPQGSNALNLPPAYEVVQSDAGNSSIDPFVSCEVEGGATMDYVTEEDVLRQGEETWMAPIPFPPQLMPIFTPSSLDDSLSRLHLLTNVTSLQLICVCDQVIQFHNRKEIMNMLPEQLNRAIKRHRQEIAAAQSGFRLVHGANTSASDDGLPQLMLESNQGLLDLVQPFVVQDVAVQSSPSQIVYGLLPDCPPRLHLGRAFRSRANTDDAESLFDELWMLGDELITPLTGSSFIRQRLAPITCPDLVAHFALVHRTFRRRWAVKRLESCLSDNKLNLNTEYLGRLRVLEELDFIDAATERGCLTLKGLVACQLQQMEVLLTQLLLDGSFTQLPAVDIAALLSCFVFEIRASGRQRDETNKSYMTDSKAPSQVAVGLNSGVEDQLPGESPISKDAAKQVPSSVPDHLSKPVLRMLEFASELERLQLKHGLMDPSADTRLNCELVRVTHAWASGHPFSTLVTLTNMQEGNLVRGLLRLDELLRHVCSACHQLGDKALGLRMNEARLTIHRDLVCAPSLYISEEFVHPNAEQSD